MILRRIASCLLLSCAMGTASAGSLDLNLSDDAVRLAFATPLASGLEADINFLHSEEDNRPDHDVASLGLHLVDDAAQGRTPFRVGVGAKVLFVDVNVADGGALAIGGHMRYTLPNYNRFAIGGDIYFAPDVTSFGDTEKYLEYTVRGEYEILRQANVYLGYRRIRAEFTDFSDDLTVDSGIHFGLRIAF